jgi:hypothetical protein
MFSLLLMLMLMLLLMLRLVLLLLLSKKNVAQILNFDGTSKKFA